MDQTKTMERAILEKGDESDRKKAEKALRFYENGAISHLDYQRILVVITSHMKKKLGCE